MNTRRFRARLAPVFLIALLAGCDSPTVARRTGALLTVVFDSHEADTMKVHVTDELTISQAEQYIANGTGPRLVIGTIVRGASEDDPDYPFRFLPETVRLADFAMELCDGAPMHTAAEVDTFIEGATGSATSTQTTWCPWSSRPIALQRFVLPE